MLNKLKEISKRKTAFIESAEKKLERRLNILEKKLVKAIFDSFVDKATIDGGVITFSNTNLNLLASIDSVIAKFKREQYLEVFSSHVKDYLTIGTLTNTYFETQITESRFNRLEKRIRKVNLNSIGLDEKGVLKKGGFLETFYNNDGFSTEIKRTVIKHIDSGSRIEALRTELVDTIISTEKKNGLLKRYWRQHAYDTQQRFNRNYSNTWADATGMTASFYSAGTVSDSRIFCKERVGKVFLIDEVEDWKDIANKRQGKNIIGPIVANKASYNPRRDCGGINCQHVLNPISDFIALDADKTLKLEDGKLVRV